MRLEIAGLTVDIGGHRIIDGLVLEAADGAVVGVVGPNGSGKSTLLRTVYRALAPTAGAVVVGGDDVWRDLSPRAAARRTAAVVQDSSTEVALTVRQLVATGRTPWTDTARGGRTRARTVVEDALRRAGVEDLQHRLVSTLSGGERQRANLARALAQEPSLLVLDEPTNHLDVRHQLDLLRLIRTLDTTCLMSLHDLNLAAASCDQLVVLNEGVVVAYGPTAHVLTPELVADVFGVRTAVLVNPLTGQRHLAFAGPEPPGPSTDPITEEHT